MPPLLPLSLVLALCLAPPVRADEEPGLPWSPFAEAAVGDWQETRRGEFVQRWTVEKVEGDQVTVSCVVREKGVEREPRSRVYSRRTPPTPSSLLMAEKPLRVLAKMATKEEGEHGLLGSRQVRF